MRVGPHVVPARKEGDLERTRESDGKASAVHFFHFDFSPEAIAAWNDPGQTAMLAIEHPNYGHAAIIGAATGSSSRASVSEDASPILSVVTHCNGEN